MVDAASNITTAGKVFVQGYDTASTVPSAQVLTSGEIRRTTHANSSLDGYALRAADVRAPLPVAFRIGAGDDPPALPPGVAAGIATGGVMPDGADAVVPQEDR